MLPNFLIIGAMKAGTSSLWHYLRAHPEVYLPDTKELNFFNEGKNWSLGLNWYESQFEVERPGVRAYGEASTNYTKYPSFRGVVEKIASIIPKVNLVYVVRDPIERIRSMYVHMVSTGAEERSLDDVLSDLSDNHYVYLSLYHYQLEQYLKHFNQKQILVIACEDLKLKRQETLRRVFRFIGVNEAFESSEFTNMFHLSMDLRQPKPVQKILNKIPLHDRILRSMPQAARTIYTNLTTRSISKPVVSDALRRRLVEVIRPDTNRLRNLVGEPFEFWSL